MLRRLLDWMKNLLDDLTIISTVIWGSRGFRQVPAAFDGTCVDHQLRKAADGGGALLVVEGDWWHGLGFPPGCSYLLARSRENGERAGRSITLGDRVNPML